MSNVQAHYTMDMGIYSREVDNTVNISVKEIDVMEGFRLGFDTRTKGTGVVHGKRFYPTLPLNGHRSRDLAEALEGKRDDSILTLGYTHIVKAEVIQNLPGFDRANTAHAKMYNGLVIVQVVAVDPGYGVHIRLLQA